MATLGSLEGFQPVSLQQEGDEQPCETDHLSVEEGDPAKDSVPRSMSRVSSVTESRLYPNPYHWPFVSRKFFVTRVNGLVLFKYHIKPLSRKKVSCSPTCPMFYKSVRICYLCNGHKNQEIACLSSFDM